MRVNISSFPKDLGDGLFYQRWGPSLRGDLQSDIIRKNKNDKELYVEGEDLERFVVLNLGSWRDKVIIDCKCQGIVIGGHAVLNDLEITLSHPESMEIAFVNCSTDKLKLHLNSPSILIRTTNFDVSSEIDIKFDHYENISFRDEALKALKLNEPINLAKCLFTEEELKRINDYKP